MEEIDLEGAPVIVERPSAPDAEPTERSVDAVSSYPSALAGEPAESDAESYRPPFWNTTMEHIEKREKRKPIISESQVKSKSSAPDVDPTERPDNAASSDPSKLRIDPEKTLTAECGSSVENAISDEDSSVDPTQQSDVEAIGTLLHQAQSHAHTQKLTDSMFGLWTCIAANESQDRERAQRAEARSLELQWEARRAKERMKEAETCMVELAKRCHELENERAAWARDADELRRLRIENSRLVTSAASTERELMNQLNELVNISTKTERAYKNQVVELDCRVAQLEEELRRLRTGDEDRAEIEATCDQKSHDLEVHMRREPVETVDCNTPKQVQDAVGADDRNDIGSELQDFISAMEAPYRRVIENHVDEDTEDEPTRQISAVCPHEKKESIFRRFIALQNSGDNCSTMTFDEEVSGSHDSASGRISYF